MSLQPEISSLLLSPRQLPAGDSLAEGAPGKVGYLGPVPVWYHSCATHSGFRHKNTPACVLPSESVNFGHNFVTEAE